MRKVVVAFAGLVLTATGDRAAGEVLQFTGSALGGCTLGSPTPGSVVLQPDSRSWATVTPASIVATHTSSSTVSVTRPSNWATSPGGTPNTQFDISGILTGTTIGSLNGNGNVRQAILPLIGATTISIWMSANASHPFPGGNYTAEITVTCAAN